MSFLDLFKPKSAMQRYAEVLEVTQAALSWWRRYAALFHSHHWGGPSVQTPYELIPRNYWVLDFTRKADALAEDQSMFGVRARFLRGALRLLREVHFRADTFAIGVGSANDALERIYSSPKYLTDALPETLALLTESLAADPDVDLEVARDLGRGEDYPKRPPLPDTPTLTSTDVFPVAAARLRLFWLHVVQLPSPPVLDTLALGGARKMDAESEVIAGPPQEPTSETAASEERLRGGFGEPYCSRECYDAAGKAMAIARIKRQYGNCAYCGAGSASHRIILARRDDLVFICESCALSRHERIARSTQCFRCGVAL